MKEIKKTTKEEKELIGDKWDVIKRGLDIHSDIEGVTTDTVICKLDEKTKEFYKEQHKISQRISQYIKHPATAQNTSNGILSEINLITILNRNDETNWLLKKILENTDNKPETEEEEEKPRLIDKILGKPEKPKE